MSSLIIELGNLYAELVRVTPIGHLPHITGLARSTGTCSVAITNAAGEVVHHQRARSTAQLLERVAARFEPQQARA